MTEAMAVRHLGQIGLKTARFSGLYTTLERNGGGLECRIPCDASFLLGEYSLPTNSRSAFGCLRANAYGTAIRLYLDDNSLIYRK